VGFLKGHTFYGLYYANQIEDPCTLRKFNLNMCWVLV